MSDCVQLVFYQTANHISQTVLHDSPEMVIFVPLKILTDFLLVGLTPSEMPNTSGIGKILTFDK